jgi:class 3 adenylate cyclase
MVAWASAVLGRQELLEGRRPWGDGYAAVRDEHAAIVRQAVEDGGGVEVSTEGDSFFVAFPSPVEAVRAAVGAQRGLAAHDWPAGFPVRVRMGLDTGEGVLGGDDYVGLDVNRAARGLVEHAPPDGASFRDLGEHRLKDIVLPVHLHELVIEASRPTSRRRGQWTPGPATCRCS